MKLTSDWWIAILLCVAFAAPQQEPRLILKVDKAVSGPLGGQGSSDCLRVYSNGNILYAHRSKSGFVFVDTETGKSTGGDKTVSLQYAASDRNNVEIEELDDFLHSKAVKNLPNVFDPPYTPIDYFETATVEISLKHGHAKHITTMEYDLGAKYPSALINLMDRIDAIEKQVSDAGKPAPPPADCVLQIPD